MSYNYSYESQVGDLFQEVFAASSTSASISWILGIASYVFIALSLYTIASRRGIRKAWLAWIPVVNVWILGSISDQYRYVTRGENKSKRKILLTLNLVNTAVSAVVMVMGIVIVVKAFMNIAQQAPDFMLEQLLGSLFGMLGLALVLLVAAIVYAVFYYMALYDVYGSCEPKNQTLYLVLSIVPMVSTIALPLFLFLCREKDGGMPPRKEEPALDAPAAPWQPEQPPVQEPWENPEG